MATRSTETSESAFTSFDGKVSIDPADVLRHVSMGRVSDVQRQYAKALLREKMRRKVEACSLYEPQPEQLRFHKSNAKERILRGCVAGETEIYDPVAMKYRRVDEIDSDFHVHAWDGERLVVAAAEKPFLKGVDDLYRVTLDNGAEFISTLAHRVLAQDGWISVGEASERLRRSEPVLLPSTLAPCQEVSQQGESRSTRTVQGFRGDCRPSRHSCDGQLRAAPDSDRESVPSQDGVRGQSCASSRRGDRGSTRECSRQHRDAVRLSTQGGRGRALVLGSALSSRYAEEPCLSQRDAYRVSRQSPQLSCRQLRTTASCPRSATQDGVGLCTEPCASEGRAQRFAVRSQRDLQWRPASVCHQRTAERSHALAQSSQIVSIEYVRTDKYYDLTVPFYACYECRTVIHHNSNRAGKTLTASTEVAWLVTGQHPYLKYPRNGRIILVGESETHIAETMWHKLTRESPSLRMIKDENTKQWRAYRPWTDEHRKDESRPMGPLLPERLWKGCVAYEDRGKDVPKMVRLRTGWDMMFCSGYSKPPQGVDVDVVFFDEEIPKDDWYREMAARLVDRNGKFIWSATPLAAAEALWNLHLRCEEYAKGNEAEPLAEEFLLTLDGNRYITEETKNQLKEKYKHDPEHYRVRILGEYLVTSFRMYPSFNRNQHVCDPVAIGDDWARYMVVDPGNTVCAVLFFAVPPDESHAYCYDELYIRNNTSSILADQVYHKVQGHNFQTFICDFHGQARTESTGENIGEQYSKAFAEKGIVCNTHGHGFWARPVSNKLVGCDKVREWLNPTEKDGKPFLLFYPHVEHTLGEMERYHKKRKNGIALDEPEQNGMHLVDCIRYAAVHGLSYAPPIKNKKHKTPVQLYWEAKQKKRGAGDDGSIFLSATGVG